MPIQGYRSPDETQRLVRFAARPFRITYCRSPGKPRPPPTPAGNGSLRRAIDSRRDRVIADVVALTGLA
jgi:hypothetical protein